MSSRNFFLQIGISLRLSDKMLILGGGAVSKSQKYEEDPIILAIIRNLRDVENQI